MFIRDVKPKIIKDSRGEKTIKVEIKTYKGKFSASAPSGKSKGKHEVPDYNERGINYSLRILKIFAEKIKYKNFMIKNFEGLKNFENLIKKFEHRYGNLGANCIYALETCFLKAAAKENRKELWEFITDKKKPKMPVPVGNCIGGGLHSSGKKPDFQEFLLIPKEKTFSKNVTKMILAYEFAKKLIKKNEKKWRVKRNDEGAWMTNLRNEDVLEILFQISKKFKVRIGIDAASSEFYERGFYHYKNKELLRDREEQIDYMLRLIEKYNLFYIEDGLQQEDFSGFKILLKKANLLRKSSAKKKPSILIVGDDLTTTNPARVSKAIAEKAINAVIIKPNQIGSLLEVKKVVDLCKKHNIQMIFSHRSGETIDNALADFAVGFGADFIKCGIFGRERLAKLGRIMAIERSLQ